MCSGENDEPVSVGQSKVHEGIKIKLTSLVQLIVHERWRFFYYLNTNFTNVASVGSAVNSTRKV